MTEEDRSVSPSPFSLLQPQDQSLGTGPPFFPQDLPHTLGPSWIHSPSFSFILWIKPHLCLPFKDHFLQEASPQAGAPADFSLSPASPQHWVLMWYVLASHQFSLYGCLLVSYAGAVSPGMACERQGLGLTLWRPSWALLKGGGECSRNMYRIE